MVGIEDVFGRRKPRAINPGQRRGDILGRPLGKQRARQCQIILGRLLREESILQHALLIELADLVRLGSHAPDGVDAGLVEHQFCAPTARGGHQQYAHALSARTAGTAGTMLHNFRIIRQICMNDETKVRQVDAARRHVGGHADARTSVPQSLQRVRSLALRQFSR